jgi:huntingtin interacting protein 1
VIGYFTLQAAQKIAQLLAASRANDSGQKLEVNEKILDSCTSLVKAIRSVTQTLHLQKVHKD